jgi:hypothetical protein
MRMFLLRTGKKPELFFVASTAHRCGAGRCLPDGLAVTGKKGADYGASRLFPLFLFMMPIFSGRGRVERRVNRLQGDVSNPLEKSPEKTSGYPGAVGADCPILPPLRIVPA